METTLNVEKTLRDSPFFVWYFDFDNTEEDKLHILQERIKGPSLEQLYFIKLEMKELDS